MAKPLVDREKAKFDASDRVRVNIEATDTPTGNLPVEVNETGVLDTGNSSFAPLLADQPFVGNGINVLDYVEVVISVYSDVQSATDGLLIEYSADNVNWRHVDPYTIPADNGKNFSVQRLAPYFRITYTNGGADQSIFELTVILNKTRGKPSSHRTSDDITSEDDAELNKSITMVATNNPAIYRNADVQNPLATDGDSVYMKDLDIFFCTAADFVKDGDSGISEEDVINSMVSDIYNEKLNSTSDAVKTIFLQFKRPVLTSSFGINSGPGGDFSNVKITLAQGDFSFVAVDESTDSTKYQIRLFDIAPVKFSRMTIEFSTTDAVSIGLIGIFKNIEVAARSQAVSDLTGAVENIGSFRQAINVNQALVHRVGINQYFRRDFGASTTLASAVTSGDTSIIVVSAAGFTITDDIRVNEENAHFTITNIVANAITLNRPIDEDHLTGIDIVQVQLNMNQLGTLASPIAFRIEPPPAERWQITRLLTTMIDSTAMDDGKFGGMAALTFPFVIRSNIDGVLTTHTHWSSNQDFKDDMFNVDYSAKAPAGQYGFSGRWTLTESEFVVDLDGATGDYVEGLVQQDLTLLDDYKIKAQGRLFGG